MTEEQNIPEKNIEAQGGELKAQKGIEDISSSKQPATENMEVHHHPTVEKKNFKEYFLEFLMIFLAVTLGFFAENFREHIVENAKEKKYINSIVEDLKTDSANLYFIIHSY